MFSTGIDQAIYHANQIWGQNVSTYVLKLALKPTKRAMVFHRPWLCVCSTEKVTSAIVKATLAT
ncbi:hypothetical protein RN22_06295 [Grimontia sp. AD028]|nr:hypothetical protein RN22_06295 [Grimontia sp. AD028]